MRRPLAWPAYTHKAQSCAVATRSLGYRRVVYRFLLTPRWLGLACVVVLLAAVAVLLGKWQFDRLDERRVTNATTEANLAADPVPVDELLSAGDSLDADLEWRVVTASGRYDADAELFVRNQSRDDIGPGSTVVVPLVTDSGEAVLVERGWVSTAGSPTQLPDVTPAPTGQVTVTGWLRQDSTADDGATVPVDGAVRAIDSTAIGEALDRALLPGYVALTFQTPPADEQLQPPEDPDLGQGPHFFYGLQWWFFAVLAVAGYLWFAWAEAHPKQRPERAERPAHPPVASAP
jgi:cytochrome oxidase assembly protein ShyY1